MPPQEKGGFLKRYWSILQQGAGLANIDGVLRADSYLTMGQDATASWADGKVKAELGDDPNRSGSYAFHFTLHNLKSIDQRYVLSSDFFTQGLFAQDGISYLDTATTALAAAVTYTVDGVNYAPSAARYVCDLDNDGDTDAVDAQIILDYAVGNRSSINPIADLDRDGAVTTYDAYLLLRDLQTGTILLKGDQSVNVSVNITLPEAVRQELDLNYSNGAYLEGYVYVEPVSTEEGVIASTHSIPVLGFYGSWTDASMYDCITYTDYLYGDTTQPYLGYSATNNLIIKHLRDNNSYFQVVNPYLLEEEYPEGRAAIRSTDSLYQYRLSLIRNAAAITVRITNQAGEELYLGNIFHQAGGAYYYTNGGSWMDTVSTYTMNRKVSSLGAKEDDVLTVSVIAIPEYYETDGPLTVEQVEALLSAGALGDGAYLSTSLTVDDSAPEMLTVAKDLSNGNLLIKARDNNYIAAVQVLNKSGSGVLATAAAKQSDKGGVAESVVDLSSVKLGPTCQVLVADYAGNTAVYTVDYGGEPENYSGQMYAFTNSKYRGGGNRWMRLVPEKICYSSENAMDGSENLDSIVPVITAAEYAEGYVYILYWATATSTSNAFEKSQSNRLLTFDLETGKAEKVNKDYCLGKYPNIECSQLYCGVTGLYIVPSGSGSELTPAEEADRITISHESLDLLTGAEFRLDAVAYPWTLTDRSIIWSSSDPSVAAVDDGYVAAVAPGTVTITATTSAAPNLQASCVVTVSDLTPLPLNGMVYDANSKTHWADFSTSAPQDWTAFADGDGSYYAGSMLDGMVYVHSGDRIARFDPDAFETTDLGEISESWIWSDAAPVPALTDGTFGFLIGICNSGTYLEMLKPEEGTLKYFNINTDHPAYGSDRSAETVRGKHLCG